MLEQMEMSYVGTIEVVAGRDLKILTHALTDEVSREIKRSLEFANPAKEAAEKEALWGWEDLPDTITLWREEDNCLVLPRGFATHLHTGLTHYGYDVRWADIRTERPRQFLELRPVLFTGDRDYQAHAVEKILRVEQGIWQAPPGAGKTVAVLEAIRRSGQKALVIVDKTNIARQWIERAEQFLGYTPGMVGDGEHEVKGITIAMQQTLWTQREALEGAGFFGLFGFVCLDECHHLPATTFMDTVQRFSARYRIGVSGTPGLQAGMLPVMEAAVGPVFHVTPKQLLRDRGILLEPRVEIHSTGFQANFWPTHKLVRYFICAKKHRNKKTDDGYCVECGGPIVDFDDTCPFRQAGCQSQAQVHRNNYHKVIDRVINDDARNELIALQAVQRYNEGGTVIILSARLKHLAALRDHVVRSGVPEEDAIMFTGEQESGERMEIVARADRGRCVLFSTIADEALDIPRLDTLVLAFPGRNVEKYKQKIGRIERSHPDKLAPLVIDFSDDCSVFAGQLQERRQLYASEGLNVRVVDVPTG